MAIKLDEILVVTLFKAIEANDPKIISEDITEKEFEDLVQEYINAQKGQPSIKELRKLKLDARIQITTSCIIYMQDEPMDEDIHEILREHGWKIEKETIFEDVEVIVKGINSLIAKSKALDDEEVTPLDKQGESTIYDILAMMSANLDGMYLDPRKITVAEFFSYQKVIKRKAEQANELKRKADLKSFAHNKKH